VAIATALVVLAYVIHRAIHLAITYDEAWTLLDFVPNSLGDILACTPCDANNQLLNTLAIKVLHTLGPRTLFMARLPNVLALMVYMAGAFLLAARLRNGLLRAILPVVLLLNPFVLDMFGLARGYGIGMAFQLLSIHQLLRIRGAARPEHPAALAMVCAALSALANLTFLLHVVAVPLLSVWIAPRDARKKLMGVQALAGLLLAALLYTPLRKLLAQDAFYHGGTTGVFHDTLLSLVHYSLYAPENGRMSLAVLILLLASLVVLGIVVLRQRPSKGEPLVLLGALVFLLVLGPSVQHHLLGTRYPLDRGALFLFAPLMLALVFALVFALDRLPKPARMAMAALLAGACMVNFLGAANTDHAILWAHEAHTEQALEAAEHLGQQQQRVVRLDHSWPFRSSLRYYMNTGKYPHVQVTKPAGWYAVDRQADLHLLLDHSLSTAPYTVDSVRVDAGRSDTLLAFPQQRVYLLARPAYREVR
jgi:hypothetical protein